MMVGLGKFYADFPTGLSALPFVYNNVLSLATDLTARQWVCSTPLFDPTAGAENIKLKFLEMVKACTTPDARMLFYFTGHASKYYPDPNSVPLTYAVTYYNGLTRGSFPPIGNFISAADYHQLVEAFHEKVPQGHLITIFDCCYAYGLIDEFLEATAYHTVIAASARNAPALYDDNSVFYKELKKVIGLPFNQMQQAINNSFSAQGIPETCVVKPATDYPQETF